MNQLNHLPDNPNQEFLKKLISKPRAMAEVTRLIFLYFFYIYFREYIKFPIAPFHLGMFKIAQNDSIKRAGIVAFRGSAKSAILNTAYALWAIMGIQQKKHVVIASQTQQRARDHLKNIRKEIEKNELLRRYLGPFEETEDQWRAAALVIPKYQARISAVSVEEGIRGLREGPHRPDLLIIDDIEDTNSTKTVEGRNKTFNWLTGELLPLGNMNTKAIFIGNFLHEDAALMRIEKLIKENKMQGEFLRVPLLDDENKIAWPGMFPSMAAVEEFRKSIGNEIVWQREYLLKCVPEMDQIIKPEDIHYYENIPTGNYWENGRLIEVGHGLKGVGVDLAISKKESADCTAMVIGEVIWIDNSPKIYIHPRPLNERFDFHQTIEYAKALSGANNFPVFFVEANAYQQVAAEEMQRNGLGVFPMHPGGDKYSRFKTIAAYIKSGSVLFPKEDWDKLKQQMIYFGVESHDDLLDAMVYLILGLLEQGFVRPDITWV